MVDHSELVSPTTAIPSGIPRYMKRVFGVRPFLYHRSGHSQPWPVMLTRDLVEPVPFLRGKERKETPPKVGAESLKGGFTLRGEH